MFVLDAKKNNLTVTGSELLTSGSVKVNQITFKFSEEWDGLQKTVIYSSLIDGRSVSYRVDNIEPDVIYYIPWELYVSKGNTIYAGVYGIKNDEIVLPTERKRIGTVVESVLDPNAAPVVPWDPDENPDAGGTGDHRRLTHREDADQHPMGSITGLGSTIDNVSTRGISNSELEAILK